MQGILCSHVCTDWDSCICHWLKAVPSQLLWPCMGELYIYAQLWLEWWQSWIVRLQACTNARYSDTNIPGNRSLKLKQISSKVLSDVKSDLPLQSYISYGQSKPQEPKSDPAAWSVLSSREKGANCTSNCYLLWQSTVFMLHMHKTLSNA